MEYILLHYELSGQRKGVEGEKTLNRGRMCEGKACEHTHLEKAESDWSMGRNIAMR